MVKKREPFSIESASRGMIGKKVLASLEEEDKFALLVTREDLQLLIDALEVSAINDSDKPYECVYFEKPRKKEMKEFRDDLKQFQDLIS